MGKLRDFVQKSASRHFRLVSAAAYFVGVLWFCSFHVFDRHTELEEHGLMPGYAHPPTLQRLEPLEAVPAGESYDGVQPLLGIAGAAFERLEIPFDRQQQWLTGLVRSQRGDGRECLGMLVVLSPTVEAALSTKMAIETARYIKGQTWLARDVVFGFVAAAPYARTVSRWADEFLHSPLFERQSCMLRQVVTLDTDGPSGDNLLSRRQWIDHPSVTRAAWQELLMEAEQPSTTVTVALDTDGANGAMANQDWPNALLQEASRQGARISVPEVWPQVSARILDGNVHGANAAFLARQLPAISLYVSRGNMMIPMQVTRVLINLLRTGSNVLQQLHHSFNMYYYTSTHTHVSSGIYLYPVLLIQIPLFAWPVMSRGASAPDALLPAGALLLAVAAAVGFGAHALAGKCEPGIQRDWLSAAQAYAAVLVVAAVSAKVMDRKLRPSAPLWMGCKTAAAVMFLLVLPPATLLNYPLGAASSALLVPALAYAGPRSSPRLALGTFLAAAVLGAVQNPEVIAAGYAEVVAAVPPHARRFLPARFAAYAHSVHEEATRWAVRARPEDVSLVLDELATNYACAGGLLFPLLSAVAAIWVPSQLLVLFVFAPRPGDRAEFVEDDAGADARTKARAVVRGALVALGLVAAVYGAGVVWMSFSSEGLGKLKFW